MAFEHLAGLSNRTKWIIGVFLAVVVYAYFINNVSTNPPGFYVDESCIAYNGYLVATTGAGENGTSFPLYFQCYTQGYAEWANPVHIYLLAILYSIVPPSNLSARIFAATLVFLAAVIMGLLARRISGKAAIGAVVGVTALFTPWMFEVSRMVLDTMGYPLMVSLLLFFVYKAYSRERWTNLDCLCIALSLSLISYTYTIGRLLGPVFGLGLLIFATNWRNLLSILKTGVIYSLTMIPFVVMLWNNHPAIAGRFRRTTYLDSNKSFLENLGPFFSAYFSDLSIDFLLISGDKHPRHHIVGMGEILIGAFAIAVVGLVIILIRYRRSPWWWYVIFGFFISVVPGSLTTERHHSLRLVALPVFITILMVPGLMWLLESKDRPGSATGPSGWFGTFGSDQFTKRALLASLLVITAVQAVMFQASFREIGANRPMEFNEAYERVLDRALAEPDRPIYLDEGGEPAYIHAFWYGTQKGLDLSTNFFHLLDNQYPPYGAIVISSEGDCFQCDIMSRDGSFILYRNLKHNPQPYATPVRTKSGMLGAAPGQMMRPRGLDVDSGGNRYVADTDNMRIQKFDPEGNVLTQFGNQGTAEGELRQPHGIAVDKAGNLWVTDAYRHRLMKFTGDGTFVKEWTGPEIGFYGPRDLSIAENGDIYIVDQGRARVVRFTPSSETYLTWGEHGTGDGQFDQPTGISVSAGLVMVADVGNDRVQVFDTDGKFIRQWPVPEWQKNVPTFPDVAYDDGSKRVFVSSGTTTEIRVYDLEGRFIESSVPPLPDILNNPSSLAFTHGPYGRRLIILNTGSDLPETGEPSFARIEIGKVEKTVIKK